MQKKLEGKKCPSFKGETTGNTTVSEKDFIGKNLVIFFYPKDSTPGCTTEGQNFRDSYKDFQELNTEIIGVSRDTIKSHEILNLSSHFHSSYYLIQMKKCVSHLM